MNALIDPRPSTQTAWLTVEPGREIVFTSAAYLVDMGEAGLAYPVLTVRSASTNGRGLDLYPSVISWLLPNGKCAGQVDVDLVTVNGSFHNVVQQHPHLAAWASAIVTGSRRASALCQPAFRSWGVEEDALSIVGRLRDVAFAPGVAEDRVLQQALGRSMRFVAEAIKGATSGRATVRFTVQDCDEGAAAEILEQAGHERRVRLREHFVELGLVPAPTMDPARLGLDDDFRGDHPEVYFVPLSQALVYPTNDQSDTFADALNLPFGCAVEATSRSFPLRITSTHTAFPTLLMSQLHAGAGADGDLSVTWHCEGEEVASVAIRLYAASSSLGEVLVRHPDAADWLSTLATPAGTGGIGLRPAISDAWKVPAADGRLLVGRFSRVRMDRDLFRPGLVIDLVMQSIRAIKDMVAARSMHQWRAQFTIDATAVQSPDDTGGEPDHIHLADVTRRFSAAGLIEAGPQVQGLFRPRSLQVKLDRHPVFVVPHGHPALQGAGERILH